VDDTCRQISHAEGCQFPAKALRKYLGWLSDEADRIDRNGADAEWRSRLYSDAALLIERLRFDHNELAPECRCWELQEKVT
jgi:hypothetical protein